MDQERFREVTNGVQDCFWTYKQIEERVEHLKHFRHTGAGRVDLDDDRLSIVHPTVADQANGFGLHLRRAEAAMNHVYLIQQICWALDNLYPREVTIGPELGVRKPDPLGDAALAAIRDIKRAHRVLLSTSASMIYEACKLKTTWNLICCESGPNRWKSCWACDERNIGTASWR